MEFGKFRESKGFLNLSQACDASVLPREKETERREGEEQGEREHFGS